MSKTLKVIGVLIILMILLRGFIYRMTVEYEKIGERPAIEIEDDKLIQMIDSISRDKEIDLNEIVEISSLITRKNLRFTFDNADEDPNKLIHTRKGNCVGYSAMFNSIADYLLHSFELHTMYEWKIKNWIQKTNNQQVKSEPLLWNREKIARIDK